MEMGCEKRGVLVKLVQPHIKMHVEVGPGKAKDVVASMQVSCDGLAPPHTIGNNPTAR